MGNMFRLLRADEIDTRVATVKPNGISLLLYKDARCDQNILDETVGPYNWMRSHSRENANCTVSLWDERKQQWISKEDVGTESKTEAEKGLASDSFKRACFNWGIGRELYSAPFIWISGKGDELKYKRYKVTEIGYSLSREINKLQIVDDRGTVVYRFGNVTGTYKPIQEIPEDAFNPEEPLPKRGDWNPLITIGEWLGDVGMGGEMFEAIYKALMGMGKIPKKARKDLTKEDWDLVVEQITKEYPTAIRSKK